LQPEVIQVLLAYWRQLKGRERAPERNAIDPMAIRSVLADAFILEYAPLAGFPLRVVGTRIDGLFRRDLRGESFLGLWTSEIRDEISEILETVADHAQPYLLNASGGPSTRESLTLEVLLLPLRHYGVARGRVFGACARNGAPPWLGLAPIRPLSLTSFAPIRSDAQELPYNLDRPISRLTCATPSVVAFPAPAAAAESARASP